MCDLWKNERVCIRRNWRTIENGASSSISSSIWYYVWCDDARLLIDVAEVGIDEENGEEGKSERKRWVESEIDLRNLKNSSFVNVQKLFFVFRTLSLLAPRVAAKLFWVTTHNSSFFFTSRYGHSARLDCQFRKISILHISFTWGEASRWSHVRDIKSEQKCIKLAKFFHRRLSLMCFRAAWISFNKCRLITVVERSVCIPWAAKTQRNRAKVGWAAELQV